MPSRHSVRTRSGAARRRTTWARFSETFNFAAAGDWSTIDLLAEWKLDGGAQQAVTVARTHFYVSVITRSDPQDTFQLGLIRGQSTDVGNNIVGAPRPSVQPYEDWLLWEDRVAAIDPVNGTNGSFYPGNSNFGEYDLKAMRKFEELGMTYNLVLESVSLAATSTIVVTGSVLLMLP